MGVTIDTAALDALIARVGGTAERTVADGVEYGIYNELGTSRMAAHPFMSPAVEDVRPGFTRAIKQVVEGNVTPDELVEKAARDVERGAKERAPVDTGALKNSIHVEE